MNDRISNLVLLEYDTEEAFLNIVEIKIISMIIILGISMFFGLFPILL